MATNASKPSASSGKLAVIEEVNYGVTPSGDLQIIHFTDESMQKDTNKVESDTIDSGEMVTQSKQVGVGAAGDINMEMFLDNDDLFLQAAMKNTYDTYSIVGSDMSIVASGNKIVSSATDFTAGLLTGMFVEVAGFSTNDFNRPVKLLSVAENEIVIGGMDLVDEAAGAEITINGKRLINNTNLRSFSIEKSFKDKNDDDVFFAYRGACINSLNISMPQEDKITLGYNIMAKNEESPDESIGTGYIDAVDDTMLDTANNIVYALLGDSAIVPSAISNITIENNLRMQKGVGSQELQGVGKGKQRCTGSLELYFDDKTVYNKFAADDSDAIDIVLMNADGSKWMVLSMPKIKYDNHPVQLSGTESDVISNIEFTAIKDPDKAYQIAIYRNA